LYLNISWDSSFDELMLFLKSKYGDEIFTIDGIGEQTDLQKFSKKFFSTNIKTAADASIDENSNVCSRTSVEYNFELATMV